MGLDSVTSACLFNLMRGFGSQTVVVIVKGLCVYLGSGRSPTWGEISNSVLKVGDLQVGRLWWLGGRG